MDFTKIILGIVAAFVVYDHVQKYLKMPAFLVSVAARITYALRQLVSVPSRIAAAAHGTVTGLASGWKSVVVRGLPVPVVAAPFASGMPAFNTGSPLGTPVAVHADLPVMPATTTAITSVPSVASLVSGTHNS